MATYKNIEYENLTSEMIERIISQTEMGIGTSSSWRMRKEEKETEIQKALELNNRLEGE
jgi:hypothetical protein